MAKRELDTSISFGPEYETLLVRGFNQPGFQLPCGDPKKAYKMRFRIWSYFRALERENLRPDLLELTKHLTLTIEDSSVVFSMKRDRWDNHLLRSVLDLPPDPTATVPELLPNKLLKQLNEIRDREARQQAKP
jgi:hypothetical protein